MKFVPVLLLYPIFNLCTPGSPFTVKVTGEGRIRESITRKRQASSLASVGSTCGLNLKIPGEYTSHSYMLEGSGQPC